MESSDEISEEKSSDFAEEIPAVIPDDIPGVTLRCISWKNLQKEFLELKFLKESRISCRSRKCEIIDKLNSQTQFMHECLKESSCSIPQMEFLE